MTPRPRRSFLLTPLLVSAAIRLVPYVLARLPDCCVQAIPFFRNSLISMAVFLPALFGRIGLARVAIQRRVAVQG